MTKIEWADITINPIVGCSKCSPGCDNCYAERFAARLAKNPKTASKYAGVVDEHGRWTGTISELDLSVFDKLPKKPSHIFVGSMTDIFHENMSWRDIDHIFCSIAKYPQHTFIILTKRPQIAAEYFPRSARKDWLTRFDLNTGKIITQLLFPLQNVWLGVTVCNQQEADKKIPLLLQTPAAKRFVSIEPMLGPVNLQFAYPHEWMFCAVCGWQGPDDGDNGPDWFMDEDDNYASKCPKCGNSGDIGSFD